MKAITAELVTEDAKRDRQGRRITPPARRAELVAEYRASGLTMEQFARREVKKTYLALVHGGLKQDEGTIRSSISRDRVRRVRMTTRREGGREAITHYTVQRRRRRK